MKRILTILVAIAALMMLMPAAALAADELDVVAWADPDSVDDGEQTTIYIQVSNSTGKRVMFTAYGVDNDFYQIGEGTYLDDGDSTMIEHVYDVSFNQNNSLTIPVQVNYDDGAGGVVLSFSDQVEIQRAGSVSVDFFVTPDANGIELGTYVNFTIECTNTGSYDYKDFTVTANSVDFQTFDLAVGQTQTIVYSECYFKDTMQSFGYYFFYNGGLSKAIDPMFTTKIIVEESAAATQQPVGDDAPADGSDTPANDASAPDSPEASAAPKDEPSEVAQDEPDQQAPALVSEEIQDEDPEDGKRTDNNPAEQKGLDTLSIVLIAAGAVLIGAVIILSILLMKRKNTGSEGHRDNGAL